ncbi:MAG: hypothetical protein AABZ10_05440 [Nitrospirota bacterium]
MTVRCTSCGKDFPVKEYMDQFDEETWEKLSHRPCNRV